ncbi:MAG: ribonuclease III [Syntrophomonadaceae bacterium]|nr:ribonuclease III [Syntrophomonadaceae bacterium]
MNPKDSAGQLAAVCGLTFNDLSILSMALTHPSYAQEQPGHVNNQRLEFLGDSILNFTVAEYLYGHYADKQEGDLTRIRAKVVCDRSLAEVAQEIGVGRYLLLGRGEEATGGRKRRSILGDTVEAIIGAIYLDQGIDAARAFVLRWLKEKIVEAAAGDYQDHKSRLQELVQAHNRDNVSYAVINESGPAHARRFEIGVYFRQRLLATGNGGTKKEAEQNAAEQAYALLMNDLAIILDGPAQGWPS